MTDPRSHQTNSFHKDTEQTKMSSLSTAISRPWSGKEGQIEQVSSARPRGKTTTALSLESQQAHGEFTQLLPASMFALATFANIQQIPRRPEPMQHAETEDEEMEMEPTPFQNQFTSFPNFSSADLAGEEEDADTVESPMSPADPFSSEELTVDDEMAAGVDVLDLQDTLSMSSENYGSGETNDELDFIVPEPTPAARASRLRGPSISQKISRTISSLFPARARSRSPEQERRNYRERRW